ncbi:hypothetical protein [Oceanicola sp. S124]|uniref:hypothetical protein n=1 Tax=Oceanicola sp. S124 TaxID=1042378 RepID=UPI00110F7B4E|nr:hypothetical protein [Oceanicola sp. S124]
MRPLQHKLIGDLRRARGMDGPGLAQRSGLTEDQIARLEGVLPWQGELSADMLQRLSHALQVRPEVLRGEQPLTEADLDLPPAERRCSCCG